MIARTLRGLGALAVVVLGLLGWPVLLLAIGNGVADWLPDLADPLALLSRPDTGGLFLVIVLALAWVAWVVWSVALAVEVSAQLRGVPTPRMGGLFPQGATAALVTAIAVAFANTPGMALAAPTAQATGTAANSLSTSTDSTAVAAHGPTATWTEQPVATDDVHEYTVRRGDTLWDIADDHLGDPTRYPEIAEASDQINQPDGRHLEDPDLILPGWTLHIPTPLSAAVELEGAAEAGDERPPGVAEQVTPPATPMRPADPTGDLVVNAPAGTTMDHPAAASGSRSGGAPRGTSSTIPTAGTTSLSTPVRAGTPEPVEAPGTPMTGAIVGGPQGHDAEVASIDGLPAWISPPLLPVAAADAADLVAATNAQLAAPRREAFELGPRSECWPRPERPVRDE